MAVPMMHAPSFLMALARRHRRCGKILRPLAAAVLGTWTGLALAAGGSYATTGTFAQSLWWLDFTGYDNTVAGTAGGQAFTFTLPNSAGTLSTAVKRTGTTTMSVVASPAWTGGGAFGHGAYNGITGAPSFYWLSQTGVGTATLSTLVMKDASGNNRTFSMFAADGENTDQAAERIVYTSTANWSLVENVIGYTSYTGAPVVLSGVGTTVVNLTAPTANSSSYNGSVVLGTQNPTQVSAALTGSQAALFAIALPPVTFNLSIAGRQYATDQFTAAVGYTTPAAAVTSITSTGASTTATTGAASVIGTNNITLNAVMAAGSASLLSAYTGSMACSNSGPGAAAFGGTNTVLPSGAGTSFTLTPQTGDRITCTLTLTPTPKTVAGTVYADSNHNSSLDANEAGIGGASALFVKLAPISGGVCTSPATVAASVNLTTGAYSLANVVQGSYCLVLDGNSTLSDITATYPSGYVGTQNSSGVVQLVVGGAPPAPQNFGLYNGSALSGNVFADNGAGGGTANNGVKAGIEAGLAGITVNAMQGATAVTSASSASDGSYTLWVPAATSGTVVITPVLPSGYTATGGSAGTTGGSYTRPSVSYTAASGQSPTGINFGMVAPNTLGPNGAQTAQPGTVVFYAHTYTAGTGGQVTFSMANTATPASPGWSQVLYQDSNCNATLEGSEPQVTAALIVTAGQTVCLIVKQFVPAGAGQSAQNSIALSAAFSYTNASPALGVSTLSATDITTVGQAGDLLLAKLVSNVTQAIAAATSVNANPGDTLQYTLAATNNGTQPLSTLFVSDSTPAFTGFVSTACPGALPTGITGCVVTTQPAVNAQGALKWTFTGSLASGAQIVVTYRVKVDQ
jgi:uncharacterized repeat protein (TIGR01451 family)